MDVLLEICVDSIESAIAAKEGGADRLEVCSSLAGGGTTPSFGLVKQCVEDIRLPVMMMIRPHEGGFVYQENDLKTMLADIEIAQSIGVCGVVFGALTQERHVHLDHCKQFLAAAH
jgi:copper homeostasis protein